MSTSALDLAHEALAAAPGAAGLQATVMSERSLAQRYARSQPTQATAVDDVSITITALRDGQAGSATTNRTEPDALRDCAAAAIASAEGAARSGGQGPYPGFPEPAPPASHHGFDQDTAELDPAAGAREIRAAFDTAHRHGTEAFGIWTAGDVETGIASTSGTSVSDRVTDAYMKVTCIVPGGRSGWSSHAASSASGMDGAALAEGAAAKATGAFAETSTPRRLEPGEYPVVLEPDALGPLLDWLGWMAFNGLAYAEERSALNGRLGERVVSPAINLADSPRFPATFPRAFDAEGVPKTPLPLIQDGVAHRIVHDTQTAHMTGNGTRSTGHAVEAGGSAWGPTPTNLVLVGGGAADEAELCLPIERGVYVTRVWYTNVVRAEETLVTGVTRDGTFLIEDGRIAAPLEDMRITDSVLRLLAGVQALTRGQRLHTEAEYYGRRFAYGVVCPSVRSAALRFTGGT